jgi:hypothetical protein
MSAASQSCAVSSSPSLFSADFQLGYGLASASPSEQQQALIHRPDELAQLRNIKTLAERVFSIIDRHLPNPNLTSLSRIIPPPTIRRHRRSAIARLIRMERELSYPCDSIPELVASEIEVGGNR